MLAPSGGLVYHMRAWRDHLASTLALAQSRWTPTRENASRLMRDFLNENRIQHLVLIGPSGGYLLSLEVFRETAINRLSVFDPDPFARQVMKRRFRSDTFGVEVDARTDLIPFFSPDSALNPLAEFVNKSVRSPQKTAFVFWGSLGQVALHKKEWRTSSDLAIAKFRSALEGQTWASLHDSVSFIDKSKGPQKASIDFQNGDRAREFEIESLRERTHPSARREILDHETRWIESDRPITAFEWKLTEARTHWLHWVQSPSALSQLR